MFARLPACLLLGLMLSHSAMGEDLRLVTSYNFAPYTGSELPGGGMLTQVVRAALAQVNIQSSLEWQPWNRAYLKTLRGEYDATFPYGQTPQRKQELLYSVPLIVINEYIFSRIDDPIDQLSAQVMQGRTVCSPLGWQPPPAIQDFLDQGVLRRHSPVGIKECARLVLMGRDDFFVADQRIGETALQLIGTSEGQLRRSIEMISSSSLHLIVPRNHARAATIIAEFDEGLASLRVSGDYQQVIEGYIEARALMTGSN
jgi:polar amino acid transport system substrate-binding protein